MGVGAYVHERRNALTEREMELAIWKRLRLDPNLAVCRQVMVGRRLADLAVVDKTTHALTIYECKLKRVTEAAGKPLATGGTP